METKLEDHLHFYIGCEAKHFHGHIFKISYENVHHYSMWPSIYKLILRPLSDMTEEEDSEFKYVNRNNWIDMHWYPEGFVWLLSKGFDIFGLIPAGLAIDKTSLKN